MRKTGNYVVIFYDDIGDPSDIAETGTLAKSNRLLRFARAKEFDNRIDICKRDKRGCLRPVKVSHHYR